MPLFLFCTVAIRLICLYTPYLTSERANGLAQPIDRASAEPRTDSIISVLLHYSYSSSRVPVIASRPRASTYRLAQPTGLTALQVSKEPLKGVRPQECIRENTDMYISNMHHIFNIDILMRG
jgi:hypothetical protein